MENDYKAQIDYIIEQLSLKVLNSDTEIQLGVFNPFKGIIKTTKINFGLDESEKNVFVLTQFIYNLYNFSNSIDNTAIKDTDRVEELNYHEQQIREDKYWHYESTEKNGNIIARKQSERARIPASSYYERGKIEFVFSEDNSTTLNSINVITSRKVFKPASTITKNGIGDDLDFIYVYGKNILRDEFGEDTIRFYFNLKPEKKKIQRWQDSLSKQLDQRIIPYQLKYLFKLSEYRRADSGVLYIHKNDFTVAAPIINRVYWELRFNTDNIDGIVEKEPLFTKKLLPGLGFAENPPLKGSSFGIHRSKIIAKAIVSYLISNKVISLDTIIKEQLKKTVIDAFQKNNIDISQPYLNKNSISFYDFDLINAISQKNQPIRFFGDKKNKYLNAAQYVGKLLEQKKVILSKTEYTWISNINDDNHLAFAPINKLERDGIELFLAELKINIHTKKYNNFKTRQNLNEAFIDKSLNDLLGTLFQKLGSLSYDELKDYADNIIKKFIKVEVTIPNGNGNLEFNPTLTNGLAFWGYLFLWINNPSLQPLSDRVQLDTNGCIIGYQ